MHRPFTASAVLVASQALIIAVCVAFAVGVARGKVNPSTGWGRVLGVLGAIYFAGAAFRLIAGVTFLSHVSFFAASLPAFFHVVLASMVLLAAGFHLQGARRAGGPAA